MPPPKLDVRGDVFPHRPDAPLVLEIGFGLGHSLLEMAAAHPEKNFIGVEVHKPGVGAALIKLEEARLAAEAAAAASSSSSERGGGEERGGASDINEWVDNVRLIRMDALWLLRDFIPPRSLSDACVYFPVGRGLRGGAGGIHANTRKYTQIHANTRKYRQTHVFKQVTNEAAK